MNKVILIGNVIKDPEIVDKTDIKISNFTLGISEGKDKNGESASSYHRCVTFGKLSGVIEKYVKKGSKVMVSGKLKNEDYINKENVKVYKTTIHVYEVELLTSKSESEKTQKTNYFQNIKQDV